jgi:hypothetical protein
MDTELGPRTGPGAADGTGNSEERIRTCVPARAGRRECQLREGGGQQEPERDRNVVRGED